MDHKVKLTESVTDILVFKTSIQTTVEVQFLKSILDNQEGILSWSVDLDDWEKILRIESEGINPDQIVSTLEDENIRCKQL